jgi:hypothetical protein
MHRNATTAFLYTAVAHDLKRLPHAEPFITHLRIIWHQVADALAYIVQDDWLLFWIILCLEVTYCLGHFKSLCVHAAPLTQQIFQMGIDQLFFKVEPNPIVFATVVSTAGNWPMLPHGAAARRPVKMAAISFRIFRNHVWVS